MPKRITKITIEGITLFPTISKIYEMILVNRFEKFTSQKGYFSQMLSEFQEGLGCVEASFTILEKINHMLERGSNIFGCFIWVSNKRSVYWS